MKEMDTLVKVSEIVESTLRLPAGKLDVDLDFENFGFDSIIAMELISNLSKEFSVSLTPTHFSEVNTVRELSDLLDQVMGDKQQVESSTPSRNTADDVSETTQSKNVVPLAPPKSRKPAAPDTSGLTGGGLRKKSSAIVSASTDRIELAKQRIEQLYSVDLSHKQYHSVDELKNDLIANHLTELEQKINPVTGPGTKVSLEVVDSTDHKPDRPKIDTPDDDQSRVESSAPTIRESSSRAVTDKDIAVVGIACRFPDADNHEQFWMNLQSGKNSIKEIPASRWDSEQHYSRSRQKSKTLSKWGGLIDDYDCFDPVMFGLSARESALMDPQERLLLQEIYTAFQDANINIQSAAGSDVGVFVGYEYNEYEQTLRRHDVEMEEGMPFSSSSPNYFLANRASFLFDFQGPSESVNTNCASSAVALNRAIQSLRSSECHLAVAGGVCLNLFVDDYIAASQYGILSADGSCGVFDDAANGFTRGEGVGVVLLRPLAEALENKDRVYAVIKESHQSNRGKAGFISEIKHESVTKTLKSCHNKAGFGSDQLDYIELDGYCTQWGDSFEFEGIKNCFAGDPGKKTCALGSVKGNIGHLEPASGIASVIKVSLSLYHGEFPESITARNVNRFIDLDSPDHPLYFANKRISFNTIRRTDNTPVRAGINSFADSGVNVHVILEEHIAPDSVIPTDQSGDDQLFILSAVNQQKLLEQIQLYIDYLNDGELEFSFDEICYTAQTGREQRNERVAILADSVDVLVDKLELVKENSYQPRRGLEKKGIFLGSIAATSDQPLLKLYTKPIEDGVSDREWEQIALLWTSGVEIPWEINWRGSELRKARLPFYPFERKRYWFDIIPQLEQEEQNRLKASSGTLSTPSEFDFQSEHYAAAETSTEASLVQIWADILGQNPDNIGIHDDFFDRGGNSQMVVSLVNRLGIEFGVQIPLTALLSASTVRSLATLIESGDAVSNGTLVCLQEQGDRPPIYAVPGAGGGVVSFQPLSRQLGQDQPFYGLQPEGHSGQTDAQTEIKQTATAYLESMEESASTPAVSILGYSNGGTVAFEMCSQLVKQGRQIQSLILLDSLAPAPRSDSEVDEIIKVCKNVAKLAGKNVTLDVEKLNTLGDEERGLYLYEVMNGNGVDMTEKQFMGFYRVALKSERLTRSYIPEKIHCDFPVILFKAQESYKDAAKDYGWGKLLDSKIEVHSIEADHLSIMHDAQLGQISDLLNRHPGGETRQNNRKKKSGSKTASNRRKKSTKATSRPLRQTASTSSKKRTSTRNSGQKPSTRKRSNA